MSLIQSILKLITRISPTLNTQLLYRRRFGKWLDLKNPQTSNEKVLWLKLNTYYKNPLVTQCADKYAVREYVEKCGCGEILNELYGYWTNPDEIDFDKLPNKFVLKNNYYYHMNMVVTDKSELDLAATRKELKKWMKSDGHLYASEMQYEAIPKKIIAEKFIETQDGLAPADYKIYCCNGKPTYVMVCIGREQSVMPKFYYFDIKGQLQRELTRDGLNAPADFHYDIPAGWDKMIEYAKTLSAPFPFVRADFYLEGGKVIFGELTFTPGEGLDNTKLYQADLAIGQQISLPK
ncbi:MAG: hypothetical protein K6A36_06225 [Paludibacteraceae bacterium]|nr:hypothetical protein [Paludibacteraceae bacterium]